MLRAHGTAGRRPAHSLPVVGAPEAAPRASVQPGAWPRVLLVVAHPDDEYYVAATVYRITAELGGTVDQVVITNGEAGFHYSQLAERYYGVALSGEREGRVRLPEIRKEETRRAGRILGIRRQYFLDERDDRFGLDVNAVLTGVWRRARVTDFLAERLRAEPYDFVFVLLPRADTHGHHKAAAVLAVEAVNRLSEERRPVVLAAEPAQSGAALAAFRGLFGFPATRAASGTPVLTFDRTRGSLCGPDLRYAIIVNWVIAEHKSQGMFQNDCGRHDVECFWLLNETGARSRTQDALARARALDHALRGGAWAHSVSVPGNGHGREWSAPADDADRALA